MIQKYTFITSNFESRYKTAACKTKIRIKCIQVESLFYGLLKSSNNIFYYSDNMNTLL